MVQPYMSEIKMFGFAWAPVGWALCDGQVMPINQNQALFALVGTAYGGDGRTTFNLPDLRGRTPVHRGDSYHAHYDRGQAGGLEQVTLTLNQLPHHTHTVAASTEVDASAFSYQDAYFSVSVDAKGGTFAPVFSGPTNLVPMNSSTVSSVGGGQSHSNLQPSSVVSFCMALQGAFPSRN